jgi:hypothetical protein
LIQRHRDVEGDGEIRELDLRSRVGKRITTLLGVILDFRVYGVPVNWMFVVGNF